MKTWNIQWHTMTYNIIWQYIMTVFNPLSLKKAHACRWSVDSRWGANCKAFLHELAWPNHPNPGTATQYYAELRSTTQYYAQPILRLLNLQRTFLNIHCKSPSAAQKCHVMKLVETNLFQTQDPMPAHLARCISNVGRHQLRPRATWRWTTK